MDKQQFCAALRARLAGLPEADITSSIEYYCEMIDDRIEDGVPETVAVAAVGSVDEIAEQILMDTPMTKLVKARMKPKRALKAWEIVLIAVGSPVWLPILIAIAAVVLSVYITLWAIIVSLYAVVLSVAVAAIACLIGGFVLQPLSLPGILLGIGAAFVCAGLALFMFLGCTALAKCIVKLGKLLWQAIKSCFIGKRGKLE